LDLNLSSFFLAALTILSVFMAYFTLSYPAL
jgi:hypothetical protein